MKVLIVAHIGKSILGFSIPSNAKLEKLNEEFEDYMRSINVSKYKLFIVKYYEGILIELNKLHDGIKIIDYPTKKALKTRLLEQFGKI